MRTWYREKLDWESTPYNSRDNVEGAMDCFSNKRGGTSSLGRHENSRSGVNRRGVGVNCRTSEVKGWEWILLRTAGRLAGRPYKLGGNPWIRTTRHPKEEVGGSVLIFFRRPVLQLSFCNKSSSDIRG